MREEKKKGQPRGCPFTGMKSVGNFRGQKTGKTVRQPMREKRQ